MDHPFHALANEYPLMPDAELLRLAESIRANGQREPVTWHEGLILDGRNRWLACRLIDPAAEPEGVEYDGPDDEDGLRAFIEDRNEHRRHLEHKWLRARREERIARVAEKRRAGKSLRSIAEEEGVSPEQVRQDVVASRVKGLTPEPESGKVVGRDGKEYVAPEPKRQPQPVEDDAEADDKCEQPAVPTDANGVEIPPQAVAAFDQLPEIRALGRDFDALVNKLHAFASTPAAAYFRKDSAVAELKRAKSTLWASKPANVCPYCKGAKKDCSACRGKGWVTATVYGAAPPELREAGK